ncbi:HD domain-containing phosphohydrolase [Leptothoe spongobia]|uniref:Histidine kinase n=1 Tax=Leptothoe spongobia TAU-MAC 1115 TaxID=1967444 RepID=A0A947DAG2_9CYAN|nr:HD domain-containing phosphohydrolase [Leptothoe spongobia]MBT9313868.1 histidine kinase [Leptothoe spongobia TAU-MAC 1115]
MNSEATLHQLKAALPEGEMPSSYGVYFKNTLVALCHALEDHILEQSDGAKPLVLVTFQQGKWYLQEADRYRDIANCSQQVAIAAIPDSGFSDHATSQLPNVDLVDLEADDSLTEEWNLIILAPGYAAMVLCHELSEEDYRNDNIPTIDVERKFYGLWTFERQSVELSAKILIDRMRPYNTSLADRLTEHFNGLKNNPSGTSVDLSGVVSRIVNYLQSSQQQLVTVNRQTRELWELEGQALKLNRNLAANKLQAFLRMVQKIDERDLANPVASLQVSALAETLGQLIDLSTIRLRRLRLAGLLFRIGLAEAPREIFQQTADHLDQASLVFWRDRAALGGQLLSSMPELTPVSRIVTHQLEYWDGSGTPNGLKGEDIPLESRILGLVAYFQELTETRGKRSAMSLGEALAACEKLSNRRFDPKLIESLSTIVRLAEIGMLQLPERPSQQPTVWLEDIRSQAPTTNKWSSLSKEVTP